MRSTLETTPIRHPSCHCAQPVYPPRVTLYEHWLKVVAATPHAIALTETSSARNWTFAELQRAWAWR
ncbi:MAG: hypothetical protein ACKVHP_10390 [Verrucomicrobiales bacterium]